MDKKTAAAALLIGLLAGGAAPGSFAQDQGFRLHSEAADIGKIGDLLDEFMQDINHKDGTDIQKLLLNPNVLFHPIDDQAAIDSARKTDARFDGIGPSALDGLVTLLATSKDTLQERVYNTEIRQDGSLGLVTFNYDFLIDGKVHHSGLEHWQVRKIDGQWKILSVTWTKYLPTGTMQPCQPRGTCDDR